ncbi:hypothetical protein PtB15_10B321 [Puccinia triticina]|nr:hypothetical protein PtB15_10B321 [Puccinia triticina]
MIPAPHSNSTPPGSFPFLKKRYRNVSQAMKFLCSYFITFLLQDRDWNKKSTISSREIQTAVRLILPGELSKHTISEGTKMIIYGLLLSLAVYPPTGTQQSTLRVSLKWDCPMRTPSSVGCSASALKVIKTGKPGLKKDGIIFT